MEVREKCLILGCGISGLGAIKLAQEKKKDIFIYDDRLAEDYRFSNIEIKRIDQIELFKYINEYKWIIKSPGIDRKSQLIKEITLQNSNLISELDFAFINRKKKSTLIAITGTNGKSTTSALTYHILKKAGLDVALVGNIGYSFSECIAIREFDYYVVEVSSFQLEDSIYFAPDIALLLNITPDHLDRHGSMENYIDIKFKITENMTKNSTFFFNANDPYSFTKLNSVSIKPNTIDYSSILNKYHSNRSLFGKHNIENIAAAAKIAETLSLNYNIISSAVQSFIPLGHRMQYVREIDNVSYYNDSKGTTLESAKASLLSFPEPIIWIVGGYDKGNNYQEIYDIVKERVHAIVVLAKDSSKIVKCFAETIPTVVTDSMQKALEAAQGLAWPGMIVLLSPACASFDLFKNYEDRGNKFIEEVYKLDSIWD